MSTTRQPMKSPMAGLPQTGAPGRERTCLTGFQADAGNAPKPHWWVAMSLASKDFEDGPYFIHV